jgi:protein disulfide-isomerase A1
MPLGADTARRKFTQAICSDLLTRSRLAPKWEVLAQLFTSKSDFRSKVTIAKCDATQNDVPDEIAGFPAIKLYPAGAKDSPVDYQGSRTVEDLAAFVRDNGKHGIDVFVNNTDGDAKTADVTEAVTSEMAEAAPAATQAAEKVEEKAEAAVDEIKGAASDDAEAVMTMEDNDMGVKKEHDEL